MKLGLIGCGYWGPNIIRNAQKMKGGELIFCTDLNPKVKDKIPESISFYSDIEEALAKHKVDGIIIATPISSHFPLAKKFLSMGFHVLIQKPMAMSVAECIELSQIAISKNLVLMVAHTFLFTASVQKLKEYAESGHLGQLKHFDSVRANLGLFQRDSDVIWDLAPHDFSILNYIAKDKKVDFLSAVGASHTEKNNSDIASIFVKYKDGFSANIHISWFSPIKIRQLILCGDQKMVVYDDNNPSEKIMVYDKSVRYEDSVFDYRSGDKYSPKLNEKEAILEELQHFCDCVDKGAECISGADFGLGVVKMMEMAQQSVKMNGAPIYA